MSMFFCWRCGCFWKDINNCFWNLLKEKNVQLLLRIMSTWEMFWSKKQMKIRTMETYSLLQKPHFWLNYCDKNQHIKRIPVAVKDIGHLFHLASEIIKADRLHLFLLSDGTRIDDNEYLQSLENGTELIVYMEEQIQKLWSILNWKDTYASNILIIH